LTIGPGAVIFLVFLAMVATGMVLGYVWERYLITPSTEE
jgi:hypothetical protein